MGTLLTAGHQEANCSVQPSVPFYFTTERTLLLLGAHLPPCLFFRGWWFDWSRETHYKTTRRSGLPLLPAGMDGARAAAAGRCSYYVKRKKEGRNQRRPSSLTRSRNFYARAQILFRLSVGRPRAKGKKSLERDDETLRDGRENADNGSNNGHPNESLRCWKNR